MQGEVVYISKVHIERDHGHVQVAQLPGESSSVTFSLHEGIAEHYGVTDTSTIAEPHASTLDYIVTALASDMLGSFGNALEAEHIKASEGRVSADADGEIEMEEGVPVIRRVTVKMLVRLSPEDSSDPVERAHDTYLNHCPAYRTLQPAMQITSTFEIIPHDDVPVRTLLF